MPPAALKRLLLPSPSILHLLPRQSAGGGEDGGNGNGTFGGLSADDIIANAASMHQVSLQSIAIAWVLTFLGSFVVLALFSYGRERFEMIFAPRIKACRDKQPANHKPGIWVPGVPVVVSGFFAWLKPLWNDLRIEIGLRTTEKVRKRDIEMLRMVGLDAVTFLQFLRLLRWLFTVISVVVAMPLIVCNYFLNTTSSYGINPASFQHVTEAIGSVNSTAIIGDLQIISAGNITGNGLYVHIMFELIVTLLVIVFVINHASHHKELVEQWAVLNYNEVAFRTIMLSGLNISHKTEKGGYNKTMWEVEEEIKKLVGAKEDEHVQVEVVMRNMSVLSRMIEQFTEKTLPAVDQALAAWKRNKGTGFYKGYGLWARMTGKAPMSVTAIIEEAAKQKREVEQAQKGIKKERRQTRCTRAITAAFVTWPNAKRAHEVINNSKRKGSSLAEKGAKAERVRVVHSPRPDDADEQAPRTRNVLWANLEKDPKSWKTHQLIGTTALTIICLFNTIPVLFIQVLANLNNMADSYPTLKSLKESSKSWEIIFAFASGILPPAVAAIFNFVLPFIMRRLARWSGSLTRGALDRRVVHQLFIFLLISQFVVFSLIGILWDTYLDYRGSFATKTWVQMFQDLSDVMARVARAYIQQSAYWLSWFPIRSAFACLNLLQLPRWAMKGYQVFFLYRKGLTSNTLHSVSQPVNFELAIEYSQVVFAMVVGLVYAPLAPLVAICATVYFWVASVVSQNDLSFVEDTKETDGHLWKIIINRLLIGTVLMQLLMTLTIALKTRSYLPTILSFVQISFIVLLKYYLRRNFGDFAQFLKNVDHGEKGGPTASGGRYEHELLKRDWMPKWKWNRKEMKTLEEMAVKFPLLREVIPALRKEPVEKDEKRGRRWHRRRKHRGRGRDDSRQDRKRR